MLWLLTFTICIASGQTAECSKVTRLTATREDCGAMAVAYRAAAEAFSPAPATVIFVGAVCAEGVDG